MQVPSEMKQILRGQTPLENDQEYGINAMPIVPLASSSKLLNKTGLQTQAIQQGRYIDIH